MKKVLLLFCVIFLSITYQTYSQTCPGDVVVIEDENVSVWEVVYNGTQIFSLAGFAETATIGGTTYTQASTGFERGLILMAHDLSGTLLWSTQLNATNTFFTTNPALAASGTTVYVSATSNEFDTSTNNFRIESFNAVDGTPGWTNSYPVNVGSSNLPFGAQVNPYSAAIDGSNNLIVAGAFSGSMDIGGTMLTTAAGLSETFVISVNGLDGTDLWATQSTGTNGVGRAWTVAISPANEIVLGGRYTGSISFGGTPYIAADNTIASPYLAKLDPVDGSELWLEGFEGQVSGSFNNIYDIDFDISGNIYYAGSFLGAIDVQGNIINSAGSGNGSTDALIGSVDSNGLFRWANQLGGRSTSDEFATTIVFSDNASSLYVGTQLVTDSLFYQNTYQAYPSLSGHYVYGIDPIDGSIQANLGENISAESNFGYSALYDDGTDTYISASLSSNTGTNVKIAQWIPNRPIPIVDVSLEDGVLDPTETLTAFDPGGGNYTFQWYLNGSILGGEILSTYTATTNGAYSVEVAGAGGCSYFSEEFFLLDGSTLESDSLALVELYNNTDGPNWSANGNWLVGDVSTWENVEVVGNRVEALRLNSNNLNGNFPQSITNLSQITLLELGGNNISGTLPERIGDLDNLTEFAIWGNQMSGSIPSSIGDMGSLFRFYPSDNNFSGPLPPEIGNLTALEGLAFSNNQITGPLPSTIGNLTNAIYFEFNNNPINDVIPPEIGSMSSLQFIQLENAQLTGSIPTTLSNLSLLTVMNLSRNSLSGELPIGLSSITNIQEINVRENQLSGNLDDAFWQLPALSVLQVDYNPELAVSLPGNLSSLTQLTILGISGTTPIGGTFPAEFYDLVNLSVLDVGGHNFTGTIDPAINDLTQLTGLWLFRNQLTGDFPDISALTNLQAGSIGGNFFTSFPDISALPLVESFEIAFNNLDFNSIIPNLSIPDLQFSPQSRRESVYDSVSIGGSLTLANPYTTTGNQYQWVRNINDSIATSLDYEITSATLNDLGGYTAYITNPDVPDLTIQTAFYNISSDEDARSWTVDNSVGSVADFKSFYSAFYGTTTGDTLYVSGSELPYNIGGYRMERQRIIYGPGYFITDNPETQANDSTARVPGINLTKGSDGTEIYGMEFDFIRLNNVVSSSDDVLENILLSNNRIADLGISDDVNEITITQNFLGEFSFASSSLSGTSRDYTNVLIQNNIIDTVTTVLSQASAARNDMTNVVFNRNTIGVFLDSIQDVDVTNNIINDYQATGNNESGTINFTTADFENGSGNLAIDNDFQTTATVGAFSGSDPYVLSGIAPIPHIFALDDIGRIRLNVLAKNDVDADIISLNYRLGENGVIKQRGTVRRLETGNPIEVLFRPKLGNITPGATADLLIWAEDTRGVKSIPQRLTFTAETTTASGQILTSSGAPVSDGEVFLFEINQEATAFDTLATTLDSNGNFTFNNIVIGDYLALGNPNETQFEGQLPTYFAETDLWEEADTLLLDTTNPDFSITLIQEPREETGVGKVSGFVEEELGDGSEGGRVEVRGRVRRGGVSMRRGVRAGRNEETEYELYSYVLTDENGEFFFENLPTGEYRINIQYPGFPMDTLTDVDILIEESRNNDYNLQALVDEGKISVTILTTTGVFDDLIKSINVYPNPASEFIKIDFYEEIEVNSSLEVELISILGESVLKQAFNPEQLNTSRNLQIPISTYKSGSYILKIQQNSTVIGTIRLIIR